MAGNWLQWCWQVACDTVWRTDFWLPLGITWNDLHTKEDFKFPEFYDILVYPLAFSISFICLRKIILEPLLFAPLARSAGVISVRPNPPTPSKMLEAVYQKYDMLTPETVVAEVSVDNNMSIRQVERWLRRRHNVTKLTKYDKCMDCAYDFVCHLFSCIFGISVMYSKPWLKNITLCWEDYPHHSIDPDVWWYYILCLSYYWSITFIHLPRTGRKMSDRVPMMTHHLFTILLMIFSWTCNFVRVGSLVLMVHECADIFQLAAKMCKLANKETPTNILFVIFIFVWLCTRCCIYPFWIMKSVFFEATTYMFMPSAYIFMGLLIGLLLLNVFWTVLIACIVVRKLRTNTLQDLRSSAEELSCDENTRENKLD